MNAPVLQFRLAIDENAYPAPQRTKPFLKWAGNKNRAKQHILPHLPFGRRLVEPFAGSCAISLATDYEHYLIADANADLIDMYRFIQSDHETVIRHAEQLFRPDYNQDEAFYRLRAEFNESGTSVRKSAIFIYMNRHGFNGLCRYNSSGKFNVPFGKYRSPTCPSHEIRSFADFASKAEFVCQSFDATFDMLRDGDVIYADPPYVPLSATSNFTAYAKVPFGPDEQQLLANCARSATAMGRPTLISNHDTPISRELYSGAQIHSFDVQRLISSKASTRGVAPELLAVFNA